nr:hypothetical protein [Tanacetum cinerariifolium]
MQESKIDTGKAVDADLVVTENSGTESDVRNDSSRSKNDTDADVADIRPIYHEEPMAKDNNILSNLKSLMMNENKETMPTKIELTLEQSQEGVSNDVLVSIEGVEE